MNRFLHTGLTIIKEAWIIVFLFSAILVISCGKDPFVLKEQNNMMSYPLKAGNKWTYISTLDFTSPIDTFHQVDYSIYSIGNPETLPNSVIVYPLVQYDSTDGGDIFLSKNYYSLSGTSLWNHAYLAGSNARVHLRSKPGNYKIKFNNTVYNSIDDLSRSLRKQYIGVVTADSLIIENKPLLVYDENLKQGDGWYYRDSTTAFIIYKYMFGMENVKTMFGDFPCYKLQFKYDLNKDKIWDNDIVIYQYISPDKGLLRLYTESVVSVTDISGNYLGKGLYIENCIATSTNF